MGNDMNPDRNIGAMDVFLQELGKVVRRDGPLPPERAVAVVRTCLRDMPGERFGSAIELNVALAALPYADEASSN